MLALLKRQLSPQALINSLHQVRTNFPIPPHLSPHHPRLRNYITHLGPNTNPPLHTSNLLHQTPSPSPPFAATKTLLHLPPITNPFLPPDSQHPRIPRFFPPIHLPPLLLPFPLPPPSNRHPPLIPPKHLLRLRRHLLWPPMRYPPRTIRNFNLYSRFFDLCFYFLGIRD